MFDEATIKEYLRKVKESKFQGSDSIHPKLIKEMVVSISKPVTKIFNKSMEEKKLPKIWKIANITPIHKKGHKYDVSNYKPGADTGFQVRGGGAHLKKLRRAEGGANIYEVFRVENHDFTPKKSYFFKF
jgi:hypothetical protein